MDPITFAQGALALIASYAAYRFISGVAAWFFIHKA